MLQQDNFASLIFCCGAPIFLTFFQLVRYRRTYHSFSISKALLTSCFFISCFLSPALCLISLSCLSLPITSIRIFANYVLRAQFLSFTPFSYFFSFILHGFIQFIKPMKEYLDVLVLPPTLDHTLVHLSTTYEKAAGQIKYYIDLNGLSSLSTSEYTIPALIVGLLPPLLQQLIQQTVFEITDALAALKLSDFFHYGEMPKHAPEAYDNVLSGLFDFIHSINITDLLQTGSVAITTKKAFYMITNAIEDIRHSINISSVLDNETVSPKARHVLVLFSNFIRDHDISGAVKAIAENPPEKWYDEILSNGLTDIPYGLRKFIVCNLLWTSLSFVGLLVFRTILHETCKYLITGLYELSVDEKERESRGWYFLASVTGLGFALGDVFPSCCIIGILCNMGLLPTSIGFGLVSYTVALMPLQSSLQIRLISTAISMDEEKNKTKFWKTYLWSILVGSLSTLSWYIYGLILIIQTLSSRWITLPMSLSVPIIPIVTMMWRKRHYFEEDYDKKRYESEILASERDFTFNKLLTEEHRKEA